jgi:glycosyltransferase involved in cell wall biosynthesis
MLLILMSDGSLPGMISVTILTKDSARHLRKVFKALSAFEEVLVLDTGSSDETLTIAREFANVRVHPTQFKGFGPLHNEAAALARHDWILSLDSDEVMTPELSREIAALALDDGCVYSISRHNYFNGKWIRWCGWYPDRHVRLYNKKRTQFTDAPVHEGIMRNGLRLVELHAPVAHYSYTCVADFLTKIQRYSDLFAQQHQGKVSSSLSKVIVHSLATFIKSYVFKRGFLGGREGFLISTSNAVSTFYRYMKLREANQKRITDVTDPHVPSCR